jgi:hypothetical protein
MIISSAFDTFFSLGFALLGYAFIARERSRPDFHEQLLLPQIDKSSLWRFRRAVVNRKIVLLLLPAVSIAGTLWADFAVSRFSYQYLLRDQTFPVRLYIGLGTGRSFLQSLYADLDAILGNVFGYLRYFEYVVFFLPFVLPVYLRPRHRLFQKSEIRRPAFALLAQIVGLTLFGFHVASSRIGIELVMLSYALVVFASSYATAVVCSTVVLTLVSEFRGKDEHFRGLLHDSVRIAPRLQWVFLILLVVNGASSEVYVGFESIFLRLANTFHVTGVLANLILPIAITRMILWKTSLLHESVRSARFARTHLNTVGALLAICTLLSIPAYMLGKLFVVPNMPWLFVASRAVLESVRLGIQLSIFSFYVFAICTLNTRNVKARAVA